MSDDERPCSRCGGPCKVPAWALDSSYFANDLFGFAAHLARCHEWVTRERLEEVARVVAETRALPFVPTFPCVVCEKFAFDRAGVTCYWCGRRPAVSSAPVPIPSTTDRRPDPTPERRPARRGPIIDAPPSLF